MTKSDLNILVIAYFFPPFPKVGGRRWAKFCKYFKKEGVKFSVLSADFAGESVWDKDIKSYQDSIERVRFKDTKKEYFKRKLPEGLVDKIRWKISYWVYLLKCKQKKGNYLDESYGRANVFSQSVKAKLENNNFTHILITGGPCDYLSLLTEIETDAKIVLDLRDPWPINVPGLSPKQMQQEEQKEKAVLDTVDMLISTETSVLEKYKSSYKTFHIPHCVDVEDFELVSTSSNQTNRIVYGGDFYGSRKEIALLDKFVGLLRGKIEGVSGTLYSPMYDAAIKDYTAKNIELKKALPMGEFLSTLQNSLANVYLNKEVRKHFFSTKFFELVNSRRPIIYVGPKSEVSNFIEENKLGFHITESNLEQKVEEFEENLGSMEIPGDYDISKNTFDFEIKRLIDLLCRI